MKDLLFLADEETSIKVGKIQEVGGTANAQTSESFNNIIVRIVNGILGVIGLVAVVMVILGGIQYMTSAGDPGKVKKGKDTILYGLIGLVIVGLAYAIVNFVIANVINNTGNAGV